MQLFEERHDRAFEPVVGWGVYPVSRGAIMNGPFLEFGWLGPLRFSAEEPEDSEERVGAWRWGVNGKGHYLSAQELDSGFGATVQATIEWTAFTSSSFGACNRDEGCLAGYGHGEFGYGFFAELSYARLGDTDLAWCGVGMLFRLPAAAGILAFWKDQNKDDDED